VVVDPVVVDEDQQSSSGVSAAVTADDVLHQGDPFHIQSNRQETSPNLPDQEIEIVSGKPELEQAAFPQPRTTVHLHPGCQNRFHASQSQLQNRSRPWLTHFGIV
jgi:hypothetical protein